MSMPQLQNLGLSGIAWAGVDIGGFFGDCTGELLARWTEFGVFQPFCRNHSAMGTAPQEPWAFGEPWETICRDMLRLRMRLLPYLYTLFEECHRTGAPILRPLLFEYPDDPDDVRGRRPVPARLGAAGGADHAAGDRAPARLPAGRDVGALVDRRARRGPGARARARAAGPPAVYVRANTPIPMWPDPVSTPVRSLALYVAGASRCGGSGVWLVVRGRG